MSAHTSDLQNDDVPTPGKLRAQLSHLLPLHARFDVRITIHQLASVPLVSGEFACRWKFKNTKSAKGKDKARSEPELEHDSSGDSQSMGSGEASTSDGHMLGLLPSDSGFIKGAEYQEETTSARGQTPWLPLQDHSVTWDQPLSAVVQMSIDRHTHKLLSHPFKLTAVQRVIAHDPNAPTNPRLGTVELDLAEFVDSIPSQGSRKGTVTRRYLLCDNKTNATLRLSVRVEPAPSKQPLPTFVAPPLPLGEILAGVSTLLSSHAEVYRTRPRALDLYAPIASGGGSNAGFDVRSLPRAYGPGPTASLIDALFNPAPVREERLLTPFTRLVTTDSESDLATSAAASSASSMRSSAESAESRSSRVSVEEPRRVGTPLAHHERERTVLGPGSAPPSERTRWWKPNRDRSRSRSRVRARVAVA